MFIFLWSSDNFFLRKIVERLKICKTFHSKNHLTCKKEERKLEDACGRAGTFFLKEVKSVYIEQNRNVT